MINFKRIKLLILLFLSHPICYIAAQNSSFYIKTTLEGLNGESIYCKFFPPPPEYNSVFQSIENEFNIYLKKFYLGDKKLLIDSLNSIHISQKRINKVISSINIHDLQSKLNHPIDLYLKNVDSVGGIFLTNVMFGLIHFDQIKVDTISIKDCNSRKLYLFNSTLTNKVSIIENSFEDFFIKGNEFESDVYIADNKILSRASISSNVFKGTTTVIDIDGDSKKGYGYALFNKFHSQDTRLIGGRYCYYPFEIFRYCSFKGATTIRTVSEEYIEHKDLTFKFDENDIEGEVSFKGSLPPLMYMADNNISGLLDFRAADFGSTTIADFDGNRIENIKINPQNFTFYKWTLKDELNELSKRKQKEKLKKDYLMAEKVYKRFLAQAEKEGLSDDYRVLDLKHKKFKKFSFKVSSFWEMASYLISKAWWNYGYNKFRVVIWTILFMILFFYINYMNFEKLLYEVYTIDNIKEKFSSLKKEELSEKHFMYKKAHLVFYFTVTVFFGIKLDNNHFYFDDFRFTIYIYIVYLSGLICIAFIFNYLLSI